MLNMKRRVIALASAVLGAVLVATIAGCAAFSQGLGDLNAALSGRSGVMRTYDENSRVIDQISGVSFRFARDTKFDTHNSEGSNNDSSVVEISLGNSHIYHVGSTLIFAESGLTEVTKDLPASAQFANSTPGTPWLNSIRERFQNSWQGKAKTIMIRSQNGTPLAVYAGDKVEIFPSDIPKTTVFRIDGKYLLVYRADYGVVDSDLLGGK